MTTYFVTRHTGAKQWATEQGISVDCVVDHLNIEDVQTGDTVLGSLPVNLAQRLLRHTIGMAGRLPLGL